MFYVRKLNRDKAGWRIYLPPSFISELNWKPADYIVLFIDVEGRIVIDKITPEKYPDFFKVDVKEFLV